MGKAGILDDYMKCWQKLRSRKTGTASIEIFSGEAPGEWGLRIQGWRKTKVRKEHLHYQPSLDNT